MSKAHVLPLLGILLLTACRTAPPEKPVPVPPAQEETEDEQADRVITITADNFTFTPSAITVKKGEKITIRLQGIAGTHGFAIPALLINTAIAPGKTVDITLPTDVAGTFEFFCSIPCGPGHQDMKGTIIITD